MDSQNPVIRPNLTQPRAIGRCEVGFARSRRRLWNESYALVAYETVPMVTKPQNMVKKGRHFAQKMSGNVGPQHLDRYVNPLDEDYEAAVEESM